LLGWLRRIPGSGQRIEESALPGAELDAKLAGRIQDRDASF
jgi:hypothetical protein